MNAVDRVRKKFESQPIQPFDYDEGYVKALNDVDKEHSKEASCDYEEEIKMLKEKHQCEIAELKRLHEYEDAESDAF